MQTVILFLTFYTLFGGFLSLLLAVLQITAGKRGNANILRFIHFICNAVILLGIGLISNAIPVDFPLSIFLFPTCCFLLGPLYFFSINALTGRVNSIEKTYFMHLIPAFLMFICEVVFQLQDSELKRHFITGFLTDPLHSAFTPLFILTVLHLSLYLTLLMTDLLPFWTNQEIHKEVRIIIIRLFFSIAAIAVFSLGIFLTNSLLMLLGGSISATNQISILITQDYYPSFFFAFKKEMRKKRYEHSILKGINTELVKKRLEELMSDEQIYKDMDLNLHTLAGKMSMSSHQLSEFLNDQMQVNFRKYVNGYRVRAAERLLINNPSMGISTIGYEVGFNSKSTFYTFFKEQTGLTPQSYRFDNTASSKIAKQ